MGQDFSERDTSLITARTPLETAPVASLFLTHGPMAGMEVPLTRETFFIGRSKNNNLIFNDKSVSRKHVVINAIEGEYVLSDLGSLKGTYVNGKKVDECTLRPGDVINIGENRMQFRLLSQSGRWVMPGRGRGLWYLLIVLILGIVIGGGSWYFYQEYAEKKVPEKVMIEIVDHYTKGVELFNKDHNVEAARKEWQKILELDPDGKTQYSIKAKKLLKNIEEKGQQ